MEVYFEYYEKHKLKNNGKFKIIVQAFNNLNFYYLLLNDTKKVTILIEDGKFRMDYGLACRWHC